MDSLVWRPSLSKWTKEKDDEGAWIHWYGDPLYDDCWVSIQSHVKGMQWPSYEIQAEGPNLSITQYVGTLKRAKKKAEQLYNLMPEILI